MRSNERKDILQELLSSIFVLKQVVGEAQLFEQRGGR